MRFIPTKFHAPLDYIVGVALIAAPWIFQFSDVTAATVVSIVLGIGLIAYSLFTDYELGVWKVAPMAVHNLFDIAAGAAPRRLAVDLRLRRRVGRTSGCPCGRRPGRDLPRPDHRPAGRLLVPQDHHADHRGRLGNSKLPRRGHGYTDASRGEVAQLVEHTAENRGVAGSIPALATFKYRLSIPRQRLVFQTRFVAGAGLCPSAGRVVPSWNSNGLPWPAGLRESRKTFGGTVSRQKRTSGPVIPCRERPSGSEITPSEPSAPRAPFRSRPQSPQTP